MRGDTRNRHGRLVSREGLVDDLAHFGQRFRDLIRKLGRIVLVVLIEGRADIRRDGGRGGQEIRAWIAAFAALSACGEYDAEIHYYEPIQEWIAGMGMMTAEPK